VGRPRCRAEHAPDPLAELRRGRLARQLDEQPPEQPLRAHRPERRERSLQVLAQAVLEARAVLALQADLGVVDHQLHGAILGQRRHQR
jgi:hypothetical protein